MEERERRQISQIMRWGGGWKRVRNWQRGRERMREGEGERG